MKSQCLENEMAVIKKFAITAISFAFICFISSVIAASMTYFYVQRIRSSFHGEFEFCSKRVSLLKDEFNKLITNSNSSRVRRQPYFFNYQHRHTTEPKWSLPYVNTNSNPSGYGSYQIYNRPSYVTPDRKFCCYTCTVGQPGPPGELGIDGIRGLDGQPGEDGIPAPDSKESQANRFTFICLPAPSGPPGIIGLKGLKGKMGKPGISLGWFVKPGRPGRIGSIGSPGSDGLVGKKGPRGLPGKLINGDIQIGPAGPQGPIGAAGAKGLAGNPGKSRTGKPGSHGIPGSTGQRGHPGMIGRLGLPGVIGMKGNCNHCPSPRLSPGY